MSESHVPPPAVPEPPPPAPPGYPSGPTATGRQNGMAVASLVLGILAVTGMSCLTGIPGVILGHMALKQIRASRGAEVGEGLAMGGLVCGYIGIGMTLLVILAWLVFVGLVGIGAAVSS